jgi:hypothetical protein
MTIGFSLYDENLIDKSSCSVVKSSPPFLQCSNNHVFTPEIISDKISFELDQSNAIFSSIEIPRAMID